MTEKTVSGPWQSVIDTLPPQGAPPSDVDPALLAGWTRLLDGLRDRHRGRTLRREFDLQKLEGLSEVLVHQLSLRSEDTNLRHAAWALLDVIRHTDVRQRLAEAGQVEAWMSRIVALVDASHFTLPHLFRQRVERYRSRTFMKTLEGGGGQSWSWHEVAARIDSIAKGLAAMLGEPGDSPVVILSENSPEMAIADLACLTTGLKVVMIPTDSTASDVGYILDQVRPGCVMVSSEEQLEKVSAYRGYLDFIEHTVLMRDRGAAGALGLNDVIRAGRGMSKRRLEELREATRSDDLATIMYTSGTTGTPKGIQFTQRNLVIKRFARALALPEIGSTDVFLCYLPLCHTFGRYLELLGCVFLGASYCFLENPAPDVLIENMQRARPTVFISIPKKWIQLHERVCRNVDEVTAKDSEIRAKTQELTGGRLRWGLSAAGYLDPEIFRFFQRQGIELMSGFGMTEATGGITMTPPGQYRDDSLGLPLPGIECRLGDDGELMIRGPYVMIGYLDPPADISEFDEEGWLHTGDVMQQDEDGFYSIVDRKKDIYKNIKGQTVAPQRVENLFRDFEAVKRVMLIGDHRDFNTALIVPNEETEAVTLKKMSEEEKYDYFRSVVFTVNRFLAPFERIVDFVLTNRDFDLDQDELTPKGTLRRRIIEDHFSAVIDELYTRSNLILKDGTEVRVSHRLLQDLGFTAQSLSVRKNAIHLNRKSQILRIKKVQKEKDSILMRVGSCLYRMKDSHVDLALFLRQPALWLGNEELVDFVEMDLAKRNRWHIDRKGVRWVRRATLKPGLGDWLQGVDPNKRSDGANLMDLHSAALALGKCTDEEGEKAIEVLEWALVGSEGPLAESARMVLRRFSKASSIVVRRLAFEVLLRRERVPRLHETLRLFLEKDEELLDERCRKSIVEVGLEDERFDVFLEYADSICQRGDVLTEVNVAVLRFLAHFGISHPTSYEEIRLRFVRTAMFAEEPTVREESRRSLGVLEEGFRTWLGENQVIAVDPETRSEYRWEDVIIVEEDVEMSDRERLIEAIRETSLIREAVFLFSGGEMVRLSDIPPGGIWISHLGTKYGKSVYRVIVQTRHQASHEFAVNLNRELDPEVVSSECYWLVLLGEPSEGHQLAERLGGYWAKYDLWSEEFISGDTLSRAIRVLARQKAAEETERLRQLWPHMVWTGLAAYFDFWNRTAHQLEIEEPLPDNLIVPIYDYQTNARIVSIAARRPFENLLQMCQRMKAQFVDPVEARFENLGTVPWSVVFSALLEIVGESEGLELLRAEAKREESDEALGAIQNEMRSYVEKTTQEGFCPRRLTFAIERYRRWATLNPEAETHAAARTIQELYDSYGLAKLKPTYPDVRVRFFRETVFHEAPRSLIAGLDHLVRDLRRHEIEGEEVINAISDLRNGKDVGPDQDYFLARLSYPHLRPEDEADFVSHPEGGRHETDIVVALEDDRGETYFVRRPLNPREVGRLQQLFHKAKLDVNFRPDHRFLVAVNDRAQLIGGIFYELRDEGDTAHLEKIVVADRYRKEGVSDGLMTEFFSRLQASNVKVVTTGFFRPEYFYRLGFTIERRYAGLVKTL